MAKQTIDIGSSPNKGDGDPLRTAFTKINQNFDELYAGGFADPESVGSNLSPDTDATYNLGSADRQWADVHISDFLYLNGQRIEALPNGALLVNGSGAREAADIVGSVFGDDSTTLVDAVNNVINLDGTVSGDIVPDANEAYDLGSASNRFRDLYLSGSTIDLGGTTLSVVGGQLQIGGTDIKDVVTAAGVDYSEIQNTPTIPTNLNDLADVNTTSPANGDFLMYANGEWVNAVLLNNIVAGSNVSLLNNDAGYITAADIPTDFQGSVFADDSTLLVDGVNGSIPYSVISDVQVTESDLLVDWAGIVGTQIQTNGLPINTFTNGDLEVRGTLSFDTGTADFADTSIQNFAPGNVYAKSGQFLYVTSIHASGTATNVSFTYDTNVKQTFYGRTEFGFNGQTPVVDFDGTTIENWTDPNVVNTANNSAQKIVVGLNTAVMDFLTVRVAENTPGELDVEFNYDAGGTVAVSANGDLPNRFNGTTTFAAGNTTWTVMNVLTTVGDKGEFTIVDHSGYKIYRVTTLWRS